MLVDDLKAYRLQITRAHLATDFGVAFDLALYALCVDLFERFGYRSHPLDLRGIEPPLHSSLNDLSGTPADRLFGAQGNALDLDWLKLSPEEGFALLAALPSEAKQRLFARCIALCIKPQLAIEDGADPVIEAAGRRLAIPFADYWRPTAANYWGRVKKAHGLAIGREILGERWARDHAGDKKPELAAALETAFDPAKSAACIRLDQAARDAAACWQPPGMAYADTAVNNAAADPQRNQAAPLTGDPDEAEPAKIDLAATELPAFLTEDEPGGIALNGASVS
jgi:ParB family chromosome partitioning protein